MFKYVSGKSVFLKYMFLYVFGHINIL